MPSSFVKVLALLSVSALAAAAHAQNAPAQSGAQTFGRNCAGCHGSDGHGSDKAPSIATMPEVISMTDAQLVSVVTNGTQSGMPPFSFLGDQNVRAVVAYLRTLQGVTPDGTATGAGGGNNSARGNGGGRGRGGNAGGGAPATATEPVTGNAANGKTLFFGSKAMCSNCHAVAGDGGAMGPDMTAYALTHQPSAIRDAILTPGAPAATPARRGGGGGGFGAPPAKSVELELKSGKKLTGVVRGEDNMSIAMITQDGRYHFIDRTTVAKETTLKTMMPTDYSTRLTSAEVNDIVAYLVAAGKTAPVEPAAAPAPAGRRGGGGN